MPWTIAHAAAVLPLRRAAGERLSFAALCIGSFSPDFGYYLPMADRSGLAHTPVGIALVCVPSGLALWVLLRWLHAPLAELLPQPHRDALRALPSLGSLRSPRAWVVAALSIALGALTHIVWDNFTHAHGVVVALWEPLRAPLFNVLGREMRVYGALQHLSTLVGTGILVHAYGGYLQHRQRTGPTPVHRRGERARSLGLLLLLLVSMVAAAPIAYAQTSGTTNASLLLVRFVIAATSIFVVGFVGAALLHAWRSRR